MMKRVALTSLVVFFLTALAFADIAIIKTADVPAYEEARNGFATICFENKQEFDLLQDQSNEAQVADAIKAGNFRLLVALGPQAATFVKENFSSAPIVFCLVLNPEKLGLKGDNITGVTLPVPVREQFAILHTIDKSVKRLGVIYSNPGNEAIIGVARTIAQDENFTFIAAPITSDQDVQKAVTDILEKCDALWIPPDPSMNSREVIRYIGSTSLSKKVPFVGPDERFVRSGAIFSISVDNVEAGKMAGDLANKILQGTSPSKLAVQEPQKPKVILNLKAAGLLGLTIPQNVQRAASKIYQ